MGISASARSESAGARRIDRRDRVERDHCAGIEPARRKGKAATLTVGLGHDVSTVLGIGRQRGSQARASGVAVSGERFSQAANRLQLEMWLR